MKNISFLVAGVGGQGTLLASDILAEVGMEAGYDVKKSDVLGLAIRGGSVLSHVRWGEKVASPVVRKGDMDYLLALEPLEAMRGVEFLHPKSIVLCNTKAMPPITVSGGSEVYPTREEVMRVLQSAAATVYFVDASAEAKRLGNLKVANVVMLGAFSTLLDVPRKTWESVILSRIPQKYVALNQHAFHTGCSVVKRSQPS
ncbi:MAG: indolepyruvate oxidoreductase subunit beta [Candidatus Bipolaricaulota bacterium]